MTLNLDYSNDLSELLNLHYDFYLDFVDEPAPEPSIVHCTRICTCCQKTKIAWDATVSHCGGCL